MDKLITTLCLLFISVASSQNLCICCTEKHQEFDFWIGSWTVTTSDGSVAGYSTISKIQENCVISENWTSANQNYSGVSYNYYNREDKQWEQLWLDNQGSLLKLIGQRDGNKMILKSKTSIDDDGNESYQQIIWTANVDGSVRQLWQTFTKDQETIILFDGLYKRSQ